MQENSIVYINHQLMIYYDILYYFPNYQPQLSSMKNWKFNCGFRGFNMIPPSEIAPKSGRHPKGNWPRHQNPRKCPCSFWENRPSWRTLSKDSAGLMLVPENNGTIWLYGATMTQASKSLCSYYQYNGTTSAPLTKIDQLVPPIVQLMVSSN